MFEPGYNKHKLEFMLDYIVAARHSGRNQDVGHRSDFERNELVTAAEDLYNKSMDRCRIEDPETGRGPIDNDAALLDAHCGVSKS